MTGIAVIILNYDALDLTIDCVDSLIEDSLLPKDTRIVVADNASPSQDMKSLREAAIERDWGDRVTLVEHSENRGFSAGNNGAIEVADALFGPSRLYLLLNPDTRVRTGAVARLATFLDENPNAGIAGSRLEDPDGTPQACAFRFPGVASELESTIRVGPFTRLLENWRVAPDMPDRPSRIDWVSGASLMVKREVVEAVGLLDEAYFLYYEELDFCLRASKAGFECWHVPESRVVHLVGQSTNVTKRDAAARRRPAYWFHSRRRYFVKHHGQFYALLADLAWLAGQAGFRLRQLASSRSRSEPRLLTDFMRHSWLKV
ncbi:glycosyltransferase [Aliihoeflea aestuarii]|uniref:glycosyltransferase family 2 protein n=1 Tax=Aliihoeflea aestuarii TaxID=453840 RepID=UPI0020961201|nr:glycosyltransferase family 2 protein [Aliihoeflea aestuarii]MCO6392311.1 glycosyltransferase [Aliihoeflea aestuarii]